MAMKPKVSSSQSALPSRAGRLFACVCGACLLTACGSGLDDDDPAVYVRAVNLVDDSPTLEFSLDDTAIANVDYSGASAFGASHAGQKTIALATLTPSELVDDDDDDNDEPLPVNLALQQDFSAGTDYTLIAYGTLAQPQVLTVSGGDDRSSVSDDKGAFRVVHSSPELGSLTVYFTAPQAGITAPQLVGTLNFGEGTAYVDLDLVREADLIDTDGSLYADLTFTVHDTGTGNEIFRSDSIGLTEQTRGMFLLAPNRGPGPAPVRLIELLSGGTSGEFLAPGDNAVVRFFHLSPDSPALDVLNSSFQNPIAQQVAFRGASPDGAVNSDEVSLIAVPSDNYGAFVFLEEFVATPDAHYTAYAIGPLVNVDAVVLSDDARSVPTQTRFRFLHASPALDDEDIDIYVVPPGTVLNFDDEDDIDDSVKTYAGLAYRGSTGYTTLKSGTYEVYFMRADTTSTVLGPVSLQAGAGRVQTIALMDSETGVLELTPISDTR